MTGWLLPAVAAAFWVGLALRAALPAPGGAMSAVAVGLGLLAWTVRSAGREREGPERLAAAGLAGPRPSPGIVSIGARPPGPLGTLVRRPRAPARAPPWLLALAVLGAFVSLGSGWGSLRQQARDGSPLRSLPAGPVLLVASLREDPRAGPFGWTALAATAEIGYPVRGGRVVVGGAVLLEGDGPVPVAVRWDRVAVEGTLRPAELGGFADARGAAAEVRVMSVERLGPSRNPVLRVVAAVRAWLSRGLERRFPPRESGLMLGLALGDTSQLDPAIEEDFRATGLGHLLAVSGQNVAMVLAPALGMAVLLRLGAAGRAAVALGTVAVFVLLTGAEPSVLRAGVMAALAVGGSLAGRPGASAAGLGGAVLLLLVADPWLAEEIGFQLSVAATAGMLILAGPLAARLRFLPTPVALAASTTIAAQAGVGPLLLFHFGQIPLIALPANLVAFPLVGPALLLGLAAAAAGSVVAALGGLLAAVGMLPLRALEAVADGLAKAPAASITSGGGGVLTLVAGVALVAGTGWALRRRRGPPRAVLIALAVVLPTFVWATALRAGPPGGLEVVFLNVGQGDAALVRAPDGGTVLVDGGPDHELVATKLAALGVHRIDLLVATHPHADHVEGLVAVLARFAVGLVVEPGCEEPSPSYGSFLRALGDEGSQVRHPRTGDVLHVGELRVLVLSPPACYQGTDSDPNNDSLVLLVTYREDAVLFPGDAEEPAQEALLEAHAPVRAAVLKVPHHGGGTTLPGFLDAVDPLVAVVSVGPNDYGHPVPWVLDRLEAGGATVLRTDLAGDVTIRFGDGGVQVASRPP